MKCDGELITSAHRLMLSAYSSHFETALAAIQPSKNITLEVDPKITGYFFHLLSYKVIFYIFYNFTALSYYLFDFDMTVCF